MKHSETENLLSLIFQSGGTVKVENDQLLVGPVSLAQKFSDQIRRLKPEILISLGCCPVCAEKLIVAPGMLNGRPGMSTYCLKPRHYDKWSF